MNKNLISMNRILPLVFAMAIAGALGCTDETGDTVVVDTVETETVVEAQPAETYVANLTAINENLTGPISGTARVTIENGQVMLALDAQGVPPNMSHLQHTHGKTDGTASTCPGVGADTNDDGVVDLVEAEQSTGTTMIPFHANPTSMEIKAETYPEAGEDGSISYQNTVSLDELQQAFTDKFPGQELDWGSRVVMIHGVPQDAPLPGTAQSLPDVPAHVTLPIACGTLQQQ